MADVLCPKCREPWELDSIHNRTEELYPELAKTDYQLAFSKAYSQFRAQGCEFFGTSCYMPQKRSAALDAIYEIIGDDVDGAISEIQDYEYFFGGLDE